MQLESVHPSSSLIKEDVTKQDLEMKDKNLLQYPDGRRMMLQAMAQQLHRPEQYTDNMMKTINIHIQALKQKQHQR